MITNRAYRMLGFVMRATSKLTNIQCIQLLFNALVRPHLEYNTTVWNPYTQCQTNKIERLQRCFTRQLAYKFGIDYITYLDRLRSFNMRSLEQRRTLFDMSLLHRVVNDHGSGLRGRLNFRNNPYPNRSNTLFTFPAARTDFGFYRSPLNRAQRNFNNIVKDHSILDLTPSQFKQRISSIL